MKDRDIEAQSIEILHNKVRAFLNQGLTNEQIIDKMIDENLQPYYIETIIENIQNEKIKRKGLINSLVTGGFIVIAGLSINLLSYIFSENTNSSSFLIFWGIVVAGIVAIIRGLILYRS